MNFVIIGGSAAGIACAETIRKYDKRSKVTVISDETFPLYSRCVLTYLIAGSADESKLYFKDKNFYKDNNIETYLGKKAVSIDPKKKKVSLEDKTEIQYDKLMLATGASPKLVDVPGTGKRGVFTIRKLDDARAIINMLDKVKQVAVLGGGLIGLRDAYALSLRQKEVTVMVKSPQVLSRMIDLAAAGIIADTFKNNGIKIMTGVAAKEIVGGESVEGIVLDNGEKIKCQLVIIGKGVKPNTELAECCGLKVEAGIVVDKFLRTSDENIFAGGDVAQTFDIAREAKRINAIWPCAVEQGEVAGLNMLGKDTTYNGSLSMNSVDFFGLGCISMGVTNSRKEEYEVISKKGAGIYKKVVLKENRIVGAIFVGDVKPAGVVAGLIKNWVDVSKIKHKLLADNFDYAKIIPLIAEYQEKFKQEEYQDTVITY